MRTLKLILGSLVALLAVTAGLVVTVLFVVAGFTLAFYGWLFGPRAAAKGPRWRRTPRPRMKVMPRSEVSVTDVTVSDSVAPLRELAGPPEPPR